METIFKHSWLLLIKSFSPENKVRFFESIFGEDESEINDQHLRCVVDFVKSELSKTKESEKQNLANLAMLEDAKKQKRIEAGRKGGLAKASNSSKNLANLAKPSNATNARKSDDLEPSTQSTDSKDELANVAMLEVLKSASKNQKKKVSPSSPPVPPLSLSHTLTLSPPYTPPNSPFKETPASVRGKKNEAEAVKSRGFVKPSLDEVRNYCKEANLSNTNPDAFFDHFESNGWKVSGKTPMRDWKASIRNWNRNSFSKASNAKDSRKPIRWNFPPDYYDEALKKQEEEDPYPWLDFISDPEERARELEKIKAGKAGLMFH